ncbi:hypothetical protein BH09PSE5_BH09PSE5_23100 [soil metagenome]
MLTLPRSVMPLELAHTYPRVCNHLALCWPDPHLTQNYFDSLLIDRRGDRRGFPPQVANELIALHEFYERTVATPDAIKAWDDRMLAVGDR